ncbi:hypothetical protein PHYSODRAFT_466585, partial [Phytophthora sojae]
NYVVAVQSPTQGNGPLYINAEKRGTVERFINHSCGPNTEFVEPIYDRNVQVVVNTTISCGRSKHHRLR